MDVPGNTEATGTLATLDEQRTNSKKEKKTLRTSQKMIGPPISLASSHSAG